MRTLRFIGFALLVLVCAGPAAGQAENPEILAYVSGGSTGDVFRIDTTGTTKIFSAGGGFRPGAVTSDGNGRLFLCDKSNSEIHILEQDSGGTWGLTTIFDKNMHDPPTPEQPVACEIVGDDLYFGERSGSSAGVWVLRGAASTPTDGVFDAPELLISVPLTSGDEVTSIHFAPNARVLMAVGNRVLVAHPPGWDSFAPLIEGLSGEATGLAVNSVGEIFVAFADLGIVEVFDTTGNSCGIYTDVSPLRPTGMRFGLNDELYIAAPKKSNDTQGDVLVAAPNGGPATRQCDFPVPTVPALPLTDPAPSAESDVELPPNGVSVVLVFEDDEPLTAKLCSSLFTVDPEFLNELALPDCTLTITCRQMPLAEFEARTAASFPDTQCFQIPDAGNNCVEMVVDGAECFGGITEIEWIFFVVQDVFPEDRPGLLFSHETGPVEPYTDNILTAFEAIVPDLPNDPAVIGRRAEFGSGLVGVTNAPNRFPVADAGEDQTVDVSSGPVTIDGSGSFDDDPIDADGLIYFWTGPAIPDGAENDAMFDVDPADLCVGDFLYTLTVTDTGLFTTTEPLSSMDSVTLTVTDADTDEDGTADCADGCPEDPDKLEPGICGCGTSDIDSDDDGTADCEDECPEDPDKTEPGTCGCGTPDEDSDGDGTLDCNDGCPNDAGKITPGVCGCGVPDTDTDGDGTPDCIDQCPNDAGKIMPGVCGCGVADTDSDGDGTLDCNDQCPNDAGKIAPGVCGCGVPDTDTDGDGTPDCNDQCPNDAGKTVPGVCGCGVPDADIVVDAVVADPDSLHPPNHQMVPVALTVAASGGCDTTVSCQIVNVTSTDPVGGPDDPDTGDGGQTSPDWIITGPLTVDLRAERSEGGDSVNDTRVYTIFVTCTDSVGQASVGSTEVWVLSDQGN